MKNLLKSAALLFIVVTSSVVSSCNDSHDELDNGCPYGCCSCMEEPGGHGGK